MQIQGNGARLWLAFLPPLLGRFDAMGDGIAQHMLQGRNHMLQHRTLHLGFRAGEGQFRLPAQFLGGLTDHPPQPGHHALKGHHPGLHQSLLDFFLDLGLLIQQEADFLGMILHGVLQVGQIVDALHQGTGQLLQFREAVQFQRIERLGQFRRSLLIAEQDLGLGFDLQPAQLLAQPSDGLVQLTEIEAQVTDPLIDPGPENTAFTSLIDQVVQQPSRYPYRIGASCGHRHPGRGGRSRSGPGDRNRPRRNTALKFAQGLDQVIGLGDILIRLSPGQHIAKAVQYLLQTLHHRRGQGQLARGHGLQQGLGPVSQFTDGHKAGHSGAALKGMHPAAQLVEGLMVVRAAPQPLQHDIADLDDLGGLGEINLDQFPIPLGQGRSGAGFGDPAAGFQQILEVLNQIIGPSRGPLFLPHLLQHGMEAVQRQLQGIGHRSRTGGLAGGHHIQQGLHRMGQVADGHQTRQPGVALEGMHIPAQIVEQFQVTGIRTPTAQDHIAGIQDLFTLG